MKAFDCKMCGTCCYGEGGIRLDDDERKRIADFLDMQTDVFINKYCEKKYGRLYIRCGPDGFCIFFDQEKQCLIHPVNPKPCSTWPYYPALVNDKDSWDQAKDACPGLNPACTHEEFVKQSKKMD